MGLMLLLNGGIQDLGRGTLTFDFQILLRLVFASYVSSHGVVPGEGARAVRTGNAYSLMPLTNVGTEIRFVTVQPFAERTLQLLTCKRRKKKHCKYCQKFSFFQGMLVKYLIEDWNIFLSMRHLPSGVETVPALSIFEFHIAGVGFIPGVGGCTDCKLIWLECGDKCSVLLE